MSKDRLSMLIINSCLTDLIKLIKLKIEQLK